MKNLLLLILLSLNLTSSFGQNPKEEKYRFTKEVFNSNQYKKSNYPRFQQNIQLVGENNYQFGEKIITVTIENKSYEMLFKKGIFNPDVVFGKETITRSNSQLDTLSQIQKIMYNQVRNDSLSICCFEELEKLNPNPQTKRFKFWLFRIGTANPTEYYIEFHNKKATKETSIEEFIENAKMTFYYEDGIII